MSSSCISRNSNFLLLSETESSDGKVVTPTVSTTSSGRDDNVAPTASSGFILPETIKALRIGETVKCCPNNRKHDLTDMHFILVRIHMKSTIKYTWRESRVTMEQNGLEIDPTNHEAAKRFHNLSEY